jgi:S1-C subfamily serine protease
VSTTYPPPPHLPHAEPTEGTGRAAPPHDHRAPAPRHTVTVAVTAALVSAVVAGLVVGVGTGAGDPAATDGTRQAPVAAARGGSVTATDVSEVAARVSPSVASVTVGGAGGTATGTGSAVIVTEDGHLVTNDHVVAGATSVQVTLADGSSYDAEVVGTDPTSDLALIDVDATGLPAASFADELPDVGAVAVAIGTPFGFDGSVTAGIVSAVDRTLEGGDATLTGMLQTDAAINPGNSGGALTDADGRIIGINTAIFSTTGANDGLGFAVPATTVTAVVDQLAAGGSVSWPVLGINGQDVDPTLAEAYGLGTDDGALVVAVVPGSGADRAGLLAGDIVTAIDGAPVTSMSDLAATVRGEPVGGEVEVTVVRDGEELPLQVTLGGS